MSSPAPTFVPSDVPPNPVVTALVSTYAAERFMRGCLEDLLAQTFAPWTEIIVVDSASPQNERAIVEEYQRHQPNIVYVRTPEREGLYAAWNRAIRMARGRYLTSANTDDRHAPHALEMMARALERDPEADVVYATTAITEVENSSLDRAVVTGRFRARKFDRRRLFYDCLPGPQPLWRRSLHERFGFFDEAFRSAGDYEFWLRISGEARFVHLPETLGVFLNSPSSLSHNREVTEQEMELARARHWPAEWGRRPKEHRSLLDRLTRTSTYMRWWANLTGRP